MGTAKQGTVERLEVIISELRGKYDRLQEEYRTVRADYNELKRLAKINANKLDRAYISQLQSSLMNLESQYDILQDNFHEMVKANDKLANITKYVTVRKHGEVREGS